MNFPGIDFATVSRILRKPQGPVDTGKVKSYHANARPSCPLPLSSFAGITEGRTGGLFVGLVKKRTKFEGSPNECIAEAIRRGLHLRDGKLYRANGKPVGTSKDRYGYWKTYVFDGKVTVARIVCWLTYGPPPSDQHQVDHINRIRSDDRPENLRWASPQENTLNVSPEVKANRRERWLRFIRLPRPETSSKYQKP